MEKKREKPKEYNCDLKDICEFCREHIKKLQEEKAPPEKTAEDALPKSKPGEEDNHPHKKAWGIDLEALKRKRLEEQKAQEAKTQKQQVTITTEVTEEMINREKTKAPPPSSGEGAAPKQVVPKGEPTSGQASAATKKSEQFVEETVKKEEREEVEVVIHRHKHGKRDSRSQSPESKRDSRSGSPESKRDARSRSPEPKRENRSGSPESKRTITSPASPEAKTAVDKQEPSKGPQPKQDAAAKAMPVNETPGKSTKKTEHFVEEEVVNTEAEEVDVLIRKHKKSPKKKKKGLPKGSDQSKNSNEPIAKGQSKTRDASPPVKGSEPKSKEPPAQSKPKGGESLDEKVTRKVTVTKQTVVTEHKAEEEDGKPK